MSDQSSDRRLSDVPREVFDRKVTWPKSGQAARLEPDHPPIIPDTPNGPFANVLADVLRYDPDEIGYEGQR
jgi:hypothetical protein